MPTNNNPENSDGKVTKSIEQQGAKIPASFFLFAALASIGTSLTLKAMKQHKNALFVGQWAAPFLLLGIYNKIVKLENND